jgi:hypothetical protein
MPKLSKLCFPDEAEGAILNALGIILVALGIIMLTPIAVALLVGNIPPSFRFCRRRLSVPCCWDSSFSGTAEVFQRFRYLKRTEGMLIVTLAWVVTGGIGGIPYLFYHLGPIDAYFESISGFTTTGATILKDFALYPKTFFSGEVSASGWAAWGSSCCSSPSCRNSPWPGGRCSLPRRPVPPRKRSPHASPRRPRRSG